MSHAETYAPTFAQSPVDPPRAPHIAAKVAVAGLAICAVLEAAWLGISIAEYEQTVNLLRGGDPITAPVHLGSGAVGVASAAAIAATGIAFIVWLYLARANAERLRGYLSWAQAWTIGGWFVPLGNLFIPFRVVRDVEKASVPYIPGEEFPARVAPLRLWWGSWYAMWVLDRIAAFWSTVPAFEGERLLDALIRQRPVVYAAWCVSSAVTVAAAVLASLVVLRITAAQETFARVESGQSVGAPDPASPQATPEQE